jgi:hypothetical protein
MLLGRNAYGALLPLRGRTGDREAVTLIRRLRRRDRRAA